MKNATSKGADGVPLLAPIGGPATLDTVTEVPLTNGSGYVVYEVADANPVAVESAQFPTFIGLDNATDTTVAEESISFGAVSTVDTASSTEPHPRYAAVTPAPDCTVLGDCQAAYFPKLTLNTGAIQLTASGNTITGQPGRITLQNTGGGTLVWNATVQYVSGSGWVVLDKSSGVNGGDINVSAKPQGLAAGTYRANILIDAGLTAGIQTVPVTLTVSAASAPGVTISKIVNAATLQNTPVVRGSAATILGSHLSGGNVSVTFDDQLALVVSAADTAMDVVVPAGLGNQGSSSVVVTVDGVKSLPAVAVVGLAYPAIFPHGVRNADWSENLPTSPAQASSVLQIFMTGIPADAAVTAQIGSQTDLVPLYAGPSPGTPGVQQVNVVVPPDALSAGIYPLTLCATVNSQSYCSDSYLVSVH